LIRGFATAVGGGREGKICLGPPAVSKSCPTLLSFPVIPGLGGRRWPAILVASPEAEDPDKLQNLNELLLGGCFQPGENLLADLLWLSVRHALPFIRGLPARNSGTNLGKACKRAARQM